MSAVGCEQADAEDLSPRQCDNCGHVQEEGDWFTGRDGHWWCSECATEVRDAEVRGTVIVTCPGCGWRISACFDRGRMTRDRKATDEEQRHPITQEHTAYREGYRAGRHPRVL